MLETAADISRLPALPFSHLRLRDGVIVALAGAHGFTVLTSDENIRKYPGVTTLW